MKKYLLLFLFVGILFLNGCSCSDAKRFKEEYESLNGVTKNGKVNRTITIDEDNPYVYTSGEEIVKKIENKETFYLYVGDTQCPWCRSVVEMATKKAKEYGVKTVYYIHIWDEDRNEVFRDKYELNEDGTLKKVVEGTDGYKNLLTYFDSVLSDYTLTSENKEIINTGKKRIYAPNFFYVKDGKVIQMIEGYSDKLTDPRAELTQEILKDEEEIFDNFYKSNISCSDKC